jgi:flagella basal body P-ring formation protein FlgA
MMFFAPFAFAACLALPSGAANITAADIHLDGVPPGTTLSLAPAPAAQRVFHVPELRQIAARFHLADIPDNDICVERVMAPLDASKLLAAMQKELPAAKVEISEISKQPAPEGDIVFRKTGLRSSALPETTWFGAIRYAPNREFTIWAKVKVTVRAPRVIALSALPPGKPIEAAQVKLETRDEFPSPQPLAESTEETVGRYPRATIGAGSAIRRDALEAANDVRQGDIVEVDIHSGLAHLKFEARAEGSGAIGETITVRNPTSTKRFQARIAAKGKVWVDAEGIQ